MAKALLFFLAVLALYVGGFVYDEVGPLLYAVMLAIIASAPLLLKFTFWKKLILMVPLLLLRVLGKVVFSVFGKNAFSRLLVRYGLLEKRFNQIMSSVGVARVKGESRWKSLSRSSQAYLLLIFLPVVIVVVIATIIIEFVRLRFLQFVIEKLMQSYFSKFLLGAKSKMQSKNKVIENTDEVHNRNRDDQDSV